MTNEKSNKSESDAGLLPVRSLTVLFLVIFAGVFSVLCISDYFIYRRLHPWRNLGFMAMQTFFTYIVFRWKMGRRKFSLAEIMFGITMFSIFAAGLRCDMAYD